jgi:hypothetical protein
LTAKKSTKAKPTPNGRVIDVSAIEWGAPEPVAKRTGQWQNLLSEFVAKKQPGAIPCHGYSKKYLSVLASEIRRGRGPAKHFDGKFDARVTENEDGLGLWIHYIG